LGVILSSFGADSGKCVNKLLHNWNLKRKGSDLKKRDLKKTKLCRCGGADMAVVI
jgi:hypothetical protein